MTARSLGIGVCLAVPLVAAALLTLREWRLREDSEAPQVIAPGASRTTAPKPPLVPAPLAAVFGLQPASLVLPSQESLVLRAIFRADNGQSRVLLASADRQAFYRVGDVLPGASVVRRIEADAVVLWRAGQEERLPLATPAPVLVAAGGNRAQVRPQPLQPAPAMQQAVP